mmetsp:Transcript_39296/g.98890  ORF Transcript_39296/g.98890 Transcript_39296/m.98890 type:complete len:373 (+) Transcript_39296:414-1532(+)
MKLLHVHRDLPAFRDTVSKVLRLLSDSAIDVGGWREHPQHFRDEAAALARQAGLHLRPSRSCSAVPCALHLRLQLSPDLRVGSEKMEHGLHRCARRVVPREHDDEAEVLQFLIGHGFTSHARAYDKGHHVRCLPAAMLNLNTFDVNDAFVLTDKRRPSSHGFPQRGEWQVPRDEGREAFTEVGKGRKHGMAAATEVGPEQDSLCYLEGKRFNGILWIEGAACGALGGPQLQVLASQLMEHWHIVFQSGICEGGHRAHPHELVPRSVDSRQRSAAKDGNPMLRPAHRMVLQHEFCMLSREVDCGSKQQVRFENRAVELLPLFHKPQRAEQVEEALPGGQRARRRTPQATPPQARGQGQPGQPEHGSHSLQAAK